MVAVGDSAEVELILKTSMGSRPINKNARVTCNDNSRGNFQLKLKGKTYVDPDSLKPLTLSDMSLTFEPGKKGDELKLKMKNISDEKVKAKLIDFPYGYLDIEVPDKEIKPGKSKDIKVRIDKHFEGSNFKKSFTIELNDSLNTRITIPVLLGKIQPTPKRTPVKKQAAIKGKNSDKKDKSTN